MTRPETTCQRCGEETLDGVRVEYRTSDGELIDLFAKLCEDCQ